MLTQSDLFRQFMTHVWKHGPREYEDAQETAVIMGAKPTAATSGPDGDDTVDWLFPDGSTAAIARNGVANP